MKIVHAISQFSNSNRPIALSIGNFDGVHLGHQTLLNRLKQAAPHSVVLTFSNRPSEILHKKATPYLTTLAHRLSLFEKIGISETLLIPFSENFSKKTASEFLKELKAIMPFQYLILGHDAVIGHDRQNDLFELSEILSFKLEYLEPIRANGKIISSSEIRNSIQVGDLEGASHLLGRPYSIFASVQKGCGKGRKLGFHTANLPVEDLALPPFGVYSVEVKIHHESFLAVANLGRAPTFHQNRQPCLEVHLIDENRDLYDQDIEVIFLNYLRPEKQFESPEALKTQIQNDILDTICSAQQTR